MGWRVFVVWWGSVGGDGGVCVCDGVGDGVCWGSFVGLEGCDSGGCCDGFIV